VKLNGTNSYTRVIVLLANMEYAYGPMHMIVTSLLLGLVPKAISFVTVVKPTQAWLYPYRLVSSDWPSTTEINTCTSVN